MMPTGAYFVGIDAASITSGIAAIDEAGNIETLEIRVKGDLPDRLVEIRRQAGAWLRDINDQGSWNCVLERPITRHGGASLFAAWGVFVEVARVSLDCPVHRLVPSEVDALARVVKPLGTDRKTALRARASYLGYQGPSQDVADAVVCAEAARELCRREFGTENGVAA